MTLTDRNRKLLIFAVSSLAILALLEVFVPNNPTAAPAVSAGNPAIAQQRAMRLRQIIATTPAREAILKQTSADLTDREKGIIQSETAPQAQATLLEIARRVGQTEQIDVRGGDLGAPKAFGDYGFVYATITFDCHIEQLVNFLADLQKQAELVVPSEERIVSGPAKQKILNVRMVLAGVVPKKLVPEKKALGAF
jgi:hypothetical protein